MKRILTFILLAFLFLPAQAQTIRANPFYVTTVVAEEGPEAPAFLTSDGYTEAWYINETANLTTDVALGVTYIHQWDDMSGNNRHLTQATDNNAPTLEAGEIVFNGSSNYMVTGAFTLEQPTLIYMVVKIVTWAASRRVFDGFAANTGTLMEYANTPELSLRAGAISPTTDDLAVNTWGILIMLFDGENAFIQVNELDPVTGSCGTADMGGLVLGADFEGSNNSNFEVEEIILRSKNDSAGDKADAIDYLQLKWGL